MNLWAFLSISVIFGVSFAMFTLYLNHQKRMKELEIEMLKVKNGAPATVDS